MEVLTEVKTRKYLTVLKEEQYTETKYKTKDGLVFEDEVKAKKHEECLERLDNIKTIDNFDLFFGPDTGSFCYIKCLEDLDFLINKFYYSNIYYYYTVNKFKLERWDSLINVINSDLFPGWWYILRESNGDYEDRTTLIPPKTVQEYIKETKDFFTKLEGEEGLNNAI